MNRPLVVIYAAIALDAAGIGLIFPILPRLLEQVTHTRDIAPYVGIMTALYAAMQFVFAPGAGRSERQRRQASRAAHFARGCGDQLCRHGVCAGALDAAARPRHRRPDQRQCRRSNGLYHRHFPRGHAGPSLRPVQRHVWRRLHRWAGSRRPARRLLAAAAFHRRRRARTPAISCWLCSSCRSPAQPSARRSIRPCSTRLGHYVGSAR